MLTYDLLLIDGPFIVIHKWLLLGSVVMFISLFTWVKLKLARRK